MSPTDKDQIMAYIDGQIDAESRAAIEADPAAMAEIAALQRQSDAIRTLYAPAGTEPVPARLAPHRLAHLAQSRRWAAIRQVAVLLVFLGIGVITGWLNRPDPAAPQIYDRLIADAVSAHAVYVAENRHAVEVPGSDAGHLSTWLSNRLDTSLAMPDLTANGLNFLGGRLLPAPAIPGGRAAQLMYEDNAGERLTLYITPATGVDGPGLETLSFGADNALYWANETFTCTIVGSQPSEALQAIAANVFTQLDPKASPRTYPDL